MLSMLTYIFILFIVSILVLIYWVSSFFRKGPVNVFSDTKLAKDYLFYFVTFIIDTYIGPFISYIASCLQDFSKRIQSTDSQVINPIEFANEEPSVKESQDSHSAKIEISIITNLCQLEENQDSLMEFQDSFMRTETDFSYTDSFELEENQDSFMESQESFVRCDTDFSYTDFSEILSQDVELIEPQEEKKITLGENEDSHFESQLSIERGEYQDTLELVQEEEIMRKVRVRRNRSRNTIEGKYEEFISIDTNHSLYVKSILKKILSKYNNDKDSFRIQVVLELLAYRDNTYIKVFRGYFLDSYFKMKESGSFKSIQDPSVLKGISSYILLPSEDYETVSFKITLQLWRSNYKKIQKKIRIS